MRFTHFAHGQWKFRGVNFRKWLLTREKSENKSLTKITNHTKTPNLGWWRKRGMFWVMYFDLGKWYSWKLHSCDRGGCGLFHYWFSAMIALCRMLSKGSLFAYCVSFFAGGFFLPSGVFLWGRGGYILPGVMGLPNLFLFDPQALREQVVGYYHV